MPDRHTSTLILWTLFIGCLALFAFKGLPWLWPRLFPVPEEPTALAGGSSELQSGPASPELAMEALRRTLAGLGATGEESGRGIELPKGRSARELEQALRAEPRLEGCEVYVTRVDDLLHRVRIFEGKSLLLNESIRPWMPERPVVSSVDPPEVGFVSIFRAQDDAAVAEVSRWRAPVALAVPPDAPHTVRTARRASWSSKGVVILVHPERSLAEQAAAAEDASGIVVEVLPDKDTDLSEWLSPLIADDLFVLDATGVENKALEKAARSLGLDYLRRAAHLDASDPSTAVLARNLSVRRGYGMVTFEGAEVDLPFVTDFVEWAREDGYALRFPVEVARQHGGAARR